MNNLENFKVEELEQRLEMRKWSSSAAPAAGAVETSPGTLTNTGGLTFTLNFDNGNNDCNCPDINTP